jgi:hypothetical protein
VEAYTTENVHISTIRAGDTIMFNGDMKTVCQKDIHRGTFMGDTIFGDSYRGGALQVERVLFPKLGIHTSKDK